MSALANTSWPALGGESRIPRGAAAWIAVSIALHGVLLLAVRVNGFTAHAGPFSDSPSVKVRLATPPDSSAVSPPVAIESTWSRLVPLDRSLARKPVYPAMLEFTARVPVQEFDEGSYRSPANLTRPPTPLRFVTVSYPEDQSVAGRVTARLTLFIDESGNVVRVVVHSHDLPAAFIDAAKRSFEPAKFHPGMVDDRPVKARMTVDVEFEDRGMAPATGRGAPAR